MTVLALIGGDKHQVVTLPSCLTFIDGSGPDRLTVHADRRLRTCLFLPHGAQIFFKDHSKQYGDENKLDCHQDEQNHDQTLHRAHRAFRATMGTY